MKQVILTRTNRDDKQTTGKWSCPDISFKSDSLELGWHDNKHGISCIPSTDKVGRPYICQWLYSIKHQGYVYHVTNVPDRDSIEVHSGNFYTQILGCIELGKGYADINGDGELDVLNSRNTVDEFNSIMNKEDFELTIVENIAA